MTFVTRKGGGSAQPDWVLPAVAEDGRTGDFDVRPYLKDEAFEALADHAEFMKVFNGGHFVEWDCGADLSADTIESQWREAGKAAYGELPKSPRFLVRGRGPNSGTPRDMTGMTSVDFATCSMQYDRL